LSLGGGGWIISPSIKDPQPKNFAGTSALPVYLGDGSVHALRADLDPQSPECLANIADGKQDSASQQINGTHRCAASAP
jgi:hypothetical protein